MMHLNPLVLVGAVIGVITALLVAAYAAVKDKKTAMGFERNMEDGEIMRRLARYARPYLSKFLIVGLLMLFSIAYDIISPLIVEMRWAMSRVVLPARLFLRLSRMIFSVLVSTAEKESSRIRMGASLSRARAMEMRCFWPPDTVTPRSPRTVS